MKNVPKAVPPLPNLLVALVSLLLVLLFMGVLVYSITVEEPHRLLGLASVLLGPIGACGLSRVIATVYYHHRYSALES